MMWFWQRFSTWFWNPDVWLPPGTEWEDIIPNEHIKYANWYDLWTYPLVFAVVAIFVRFLLLNKFVYAPVALYFGIKDIRVRPVEPNAMLEALFRKYKRQVIPNDEITRISHEIGNTERYIERWLRKRRALTLISCHKKFMECEWQLSYYTSMFIYGLIVMLGKPWLWDINYCWYDYPHQSVDSDVWWYYMLSLSFYWSMTLTHFFDSNRKDFWQMFSHHLITITLISFSWTCNLTRVGTLVLVIHDIADIPLNFAKLCIYMNANAVADTIFVIFALTWVITRVIVYPLWIVRNTAFYATDIVPMFPAYYIFNSLLVLLLILHVYWTYLIMQIAVKTMKVGQVEDARSSDELTEISSDSDYSKKED